MGKSYKPYEVLAHTADARIRAFGDSLPELFEHAMKGMFHILDPVIKVPEQRAQHEVTVRSSKVEYLLVEFLSECLYLSDIHDEMYSDVVIELLTQTEMKALVKGYSISRFNGPEIKAVTYHDIKIECEKGLWRATIVFDI